MGNNIPVEHYVYQPYVVGQNNGYLWAVASPYNRECETVIKGLSKDEAFLIASVLNDKQKISELVEAITSLPDAELIPPHALISRFNAIKSKAKELKDGSND